MLIGQQGELLNFNKRDFDMTKFAKTLITGIVLTLGAAASAQAADETFTAAFKIDNTVSAEQAYEVLKEQAREVCETELLREGFRKSELTNWVRNKCEKTVLENAVKAADHPEMTFVHNETWGLKAKRTSYAQK